MIFKNQEFKNSRFQEFKNLGFQTLDQTGALPIFKGFLIAELLCLAGEAGLPFTSPNIALMP